MRRALAALVLGGALFAARGCGARTGLDDGSLLDVGGSSGGASGSGSGGSGSGSGGGTSSSSSGGVTPQCAGGGLVVLYTGPALVPGDPQGLGALVVDAANAYFTAPPPGGGAGGAVMAVPLCGGSAVTLASPTSSSALVALGALAVGSSSVYWVLHVESAATPKDQVMQAPLGGGPSTAIVHDQSPVALALDATSVYWADDRSDTVWKAPLAGGTPRPLVSYPQGEIGGVVVGPMGVYYFSPSFGIEQVPLNGGQATSLVEVGGLADSVSSLALSGGSLYWSNGLEQNATIQAMPVTGTQPTTLASASPTDAFGPIAVDGANVYWLGAECSTGIFGACAGFVRKVPLASGTPTTVASGWPSSTALGSIAVDATSVYWTAGNTVMKMTPK